MYLDVVRQQTTRWTNVGWPDIYNRN